MMPKSSLTPALSESPDRILASQVDRRVESSFRTTLMDLVGSGEKIMLLTAPVLVIGLILNVLFPTWFSVGGPSTVLQTVSIIFLIPGIVIWLWSVALILIKVPQKKLITFGPYAFVKHPLYTGVSLLVLPWVGFLLNSWLGVLVGLVLYSASRIFVSEEERQLSATFGTAWEGYCQKVKVRWL